LPILIYAEQSGEFDWRKDCPVELKIMLEKSVDHFFLSRCKNENCHYGHKHGNLRESMNFLTKQLSGVERKPKTGWYRDDRSGMKFKVPKEIEALSNWAGKTGSLYKKIDTSRVWAWWVAQYPDDKAKSSDEVNEAKRDPGFDAPWHELSDFSWGAGNLVDTNLNHTVPAFNKVRPSKTVLVGKTSIGKRAYGFLCEGDHLAMAKLGNLCKRQKKSLGHTPAPLRWLGKNDPINGAPETLDENVRKRDSLSELHAIAKSDPLKAATFVSWQIREKVIELGRQGVPLGEFTNQIQNEVEKYFDSLLDSHRKGQRNVILSDLRKADPGQTTIMYEYRYEKVVQFLESRPAALKSLTK
jgi:hypothetical protein